MKVTLKIQTQQATQEHSFNVGKTSVIGRSSKSNLKVEDSIISSSHCSFTLKHDRLELEDLKSKNGTYLNGIRVEQSEIFIGDEIKIGNTRISIIEEKLDEEAIKMLTFPGPFTDRLGHNLKVDFTGARIKNQVHDKKPNFQAHTEEIRIRKKAKSQIRLSKQEIKYKFKMRSNLAGIFDVVLFIALFLVPLVILNYTINSKGISIPGLHIDPVIVSANRRSILISSEFLLITAFFTLNFKIMKFSLGEKISGIETLYRQQ